MRPTKDCRCNARGSGIRKIYLGISRKRTALFCGSSNVHKEAFDYNDIKKTFSTPKGAKTFAEETGIDTFVAAVGNLHGSYPVPKVLDGYSKNP